MSDFYLLCPGCNTEINADIPRDTELKENEEGEVVVKYLCFGCECTVESPRYKYTKHEVTTIRSKRSNKVYTITETEHGISCTCEGFYWRRKCSHVTDFRLWKRNRELFGKDTS